MNRIIISVTDETFKYLEKKETEELRSRSFVANELLEAAITAEKRRKKLKNKNRKVSNHAADKRSGNSGRQSVLQDPAFKTAQAGTEAINAFGEI